MVYKSMTYSKMSIIYIEINNTDSFFHCYFCISLFYHPQVFYKPCWFKQTYYQHNYEFFFFLEGECEVFNFY
jgi:hypothetical protein